MTAAIRSNFQLGNAWFICDVCSQRFRRSEMLVRWDNMRVDIRCNDRRPPQMTPANLYPEGMPFPDTRPPQDPGDVLQDDSYLQSAMGGIFITTGIKPIYPSGQASPDGAIAPQDVLDAPQPPPSASVVEDDRVIRTGPVAAPSVPGA